MQHMMEELREVKNNFLIKIKEAKSVGDLQEIQKKTLHKRGIISAYLVIIRGFPKDERALISKELKSMQKILENEIKLREDEINLGSRVEGVSDEGKSINDAKSEIGKSEEGMSDGSKSINDAKNVKEKGRATKPGAEFLTDEDEIYANIDLTLPCREESIGYAHVITKTINELIEIFSAIGFNLIDGPDIEDEYHNFTALNTPEHHPARQMQDSFYLNGGEDPKNKIMLRTQTSSVQIRAMKNGKPPFHFISTGKVYRRDWDKTHTPMFHQIEGLFVDKDVSFANLKWCIEYFIAHFFKRDDIEIRFRPSFFPFTEPSAEVDIKTANHPQWLEVLGCGMVHQNVLKNVGISFDEYCGFAFGMGIERIAMLKYNIEDSRQFFNGNINWLSDYNLSFFNL